MTTPHPGDEFAFDLDGVAISGRYLEVDPPHRLVLRWQRNELDRPALLSATVEITLTPTAEGTSVRVEFSDLPPEEAAQFSQLWATHLGRVAAAVTG